MKRITIITDSLGLPRTCTDISLTWSDRFMQFVADSTNANTIGKQTIGGGGGNIIYFSPMRWRHTGDVLGQREDLLVFRHNDIVILQVGIVEASRRIMPRRWEKLLMISPLVYEVYLFFARKLMKFLTSLYALHFVSPQIFKKNIYKIHKEIKSANPKARICWIAIAPAGQKLRQKISFIQQDIDLYNEILRQCAMELKFSFLNPYNNLSLLEQEELTIADGHHLSGFGHSKVFESIKSWYLDNLDSAKFS